MVWNIFYFPYIRNNHPNWLPYFSVVLKPPTSSKSRDDHGIKMDTVNHLPTGAGFFFHPGSYKGMVQHLPSTLGKKKKLKCEVSCRCSVLLIKAKDFWWWWWWWWRRRGWWWPWPWPSRKAVTHRVSFSSSARLFSESSACLVAWTVTSQWCLLLHHRNCPLVNKHSYWNGHRTSEFSHRKWWFKP